jgi:hypothetical protein
MDLHPLILKQLGDWRVDELRAAARRQEIVADVRAGRPRVAVPRWRRAVGGALVSAGMRVRGAQPC